jgi:hypothetical protein
MRYIRGLIRSQAGSRDETRHSDQGGAWHTGAGFPLELSSKRSSRGSSSQLTSNIPTILNSSVRNDLCKPALALGRAWILAESVSATL